MASGTQVIDAQSAHLTKLRDIDTRDFVNYYDILESTWAKEWANVSSKIDLDSLQTLRANMDHAVDYLLTRNLHADKFQDFLSKITEKLEDLIKLTDSSIWTLEKNKKLNRSSRDNVMTILIAQKVELEDRLSRLKKRAS